MNPQRFPLPVTPAAAHQQVELALRPRLMHRYLTSVHAQPAGHGQVACHILDAKYEPDAHCSILYQLGEQLLIGELQWNGAAQGAPVTLAHIDQGAPETLAHIDALEMQIYPFEHDPALPGLTTVLDGPGMARLLSDNLLNNVLPACATGETRILRCQVTPLRYRLGKRCTLRFDLRLRDKATGAIYKRTLYGKLYHSQAKAQAVYAEMQMLSASPALRAGQVEVAQAVAFIPELPLVLQAPVDGLPLDMWLSQPKRTALGGHPGVVAGIRRAAAALAALHQVAAISTRVRAVAPELERFQRRSAIIMPVSPTVGAGLNALARALPAWLDCLPAWGAETSVVHGDCKPSQFFVTPSAQGSSGAIQVALLDFDHCGMADPAADVGNFLATLRQLGVQQALTQRAPATGEALQQRLATLEEQFLAEYLATRTCHPDFHRRATWYQAVALLRKALRSFSRSARSPLPGLLVQEAWLCLATLPPV
ncbi:MAG: phosphotransferase [Chloroflexi bacterium]|nr:phosphotransferase [Chloroflexota bacterium]